MTQVQHAQVEHGQEYRIKWKVRLPHPRGAVETGIDDYAIVGRETFGKLILRNLYTSDHLYLFDNEILEATPLRKKNVARRRRA